MMLIIYRSQIHRYVFVVFAGQVTVVRSMKMLFCRICVGWVSVIGV